MIIKKIEAHNFRLLKGVELTLEDGATVIVGRNNSGKTSLTELFRRLLSGTPSFKLEDFSLNVHEAFWTAFNLKLHGKGDSEICAALPSIKVGITIGYQKNEALGPLSEFIIDLDEACTDVRIDINYVLEVARVKDFFYGIDVGADPKEKKTRFYKTLRERLSKHYKAKLFAVDPNDPTNRKEQDWTKLVSLIHGGFVNAQRGMDDVTHKENDVLGKILGMLFQSAMSESADEADRATAKELSEAVEGVQADINLKFDATLKGLLPAFKLFGYPGLPDPELRTETVFDVELLLNNNTRVLYPGANGINLPEAYNGLGARNLIYILLKLHEFFKAFKALQPAPGIHIVFIEEPEAHLHPQMQEVFISKLGEIAKVFAKEYNAGEKWPVQFVVTTHSSHMANRAAFKNMRYFLARANKETVIKDLSTGFAGVLKENEEFLHQYMTLTRCDLLFADKAVLIEGTSERLLLPKMIEKLDERKEPEERLSSQYISVVEVGGAYAHRFLKLLDFLELRTLVITDLDSAKKGADGKLGACKVADGTHTTNGCIKDWFNATEVTPAQLIGKTAAEKTNGLLRLAYQIPDKTGAPCGRSLEESFILANPALFGLDDKSLAKAWDIADKQKKSEFALKYAIGEMTWTTPLYIADGLRWLAADLVKVHGKTPPAAKKGKNPETKTA